MSTNPKKLVYTGPLAEVGLISTATGRVYAAERGKPFSVAEEDADALVRRYGQVLRRIEDKPKPRSPKGKADAGAGAEANPERETP